jgi:hypothetical protein
MTKTTSSAIVIILVAGGDVVLTEALTQVLRAPRLGLLWPGTVTTPTDHWVR